MTKEDSSRIQSTQVSPWKGGGFPPPLLTSVDWDWLRQRLVKTLVRALFPPVRNQLAINTSPRRKVPAAATTLPGAVLLAARLKAKQRNERY